MPSGRTRMLSCAVIATLCVSVCINAEQPTVDDVRSSGDEAAAIIYLITHSAARVDAGPAAIWPHIVDSSAWKGAATAELVSGIVGQVGEKQKIRGGEGDAEYRFWTEVVEPVPEKRKVIAIYFDEQADGDISFASWTLFPSAVGTLVTYDVYSTTRIPGVKPDDIDPLRQQITAANQARFDQELQRLKQLVEGARP